MSLQTKFAVLLALLGLTVLSSLGAAWWSVTILHHEQAGFFSSMADVLEGLGRVKRQLDEQGEILAAPAATESPRAAPAEPAPPGVLTPGRPGPEEVSRFDELSVGCRRDLDALERNSLSVARAGKTTFGNVRQRLDAFHRTVHRWLDMTADETAPQDAEARRTRVEAIEAARQDAIGEHATLQKLLDRAELRILADTEQAVVYGDQIRARLLQVLAFAFVTAVLVGSLGLILLRRWVVHPVAALRTAAARIADGDLDHRLPVQGRDELAQLSGEVNHMAAMVRAMQEERVERERLAAVGEMVRRLAHNLRNPLAGIRGLAEVSRDELAPDSDVRENQDRIIASVDRFEKWLADLLGVTRPLAIRPERGHVRAVLAGVIEAHRPMARTKGVLLELDAAQAPDVATFDARHLEHTLVAIVTNAIQASPPGGTVRVQARASQDGEDWEVRVSDQGPGVPPELHDKIFKPYFTTKRDGNGIGLALAQQVVRAHGGRITVEPGLGKGLGAPPEVIGAVFVVRIPFDIPAGLGQELANTGQAGAQGGQDSDHRRRGEPAVLDPTHARQGRA